MPLIGRIRRVGKEVRLRGRRILGRNMGLAELSMVLLVVVGVPRHRRRRRAR